LLVHIDFITGSIHGQKRQLAPELTNLALPHRPAWVAWRAQIFSRGPRVLYLPRLRGHEAGRWRRAEVKRSAMLRDESQRGDERYQRQDQGGAPNTTAPWREALSMAGI
jgi:hypothetical protein